MRLLRRLARKTRRDWACLHLVVVQVLYSGLIQSRVQVDRYVPYHLRQFRHLYTTEHKKQTQHTYGNTKWPVDLENTSYIPAVKDVSQYRNRQRSTKITFGTGFHAGTIPSLTTRVLHSQFPTIVPNYHFQGPQNGHPRSLIPHRQ